MLRRSDASNFKLIIVSFTNQKEYCEEYLDMVVDDKYLDRVEFYIDANRNLYKQLGFDWKFGQDNERKAIWKPWVIKEYAKTHHTTKGEDYGSAMGLPKDFSYDDFVFRKFVKDDDPFQQAGDAVLDKSGRLIQIFPMIHVSDRVDIDVILGTE